MNFSHNARALAQVVPFVRRSSAVDRSPAAGTGQRAAAPVLFLHGWGVGPHAYGAALGHLGALGLRVLAPAQPGFGRTPPLEGDRCSFAGYAAWAAGYLEAAQVRGPVTVVGHSFGGGVAVQLAHDHPGKVAALVLCNAVGGSTSGAGDSGAPGGVPERPWWEWGRILGADLLAGDSAARVLPAVLGEAVSNLVWNPLALWRVGEFVRRADLLAELGEVRRRGVPVTVVWSDRDRLVPHAGFRALCGASGVDGVVVPGSHSWLIAHPRRFADIVLRAMVEAGALRPALSAAG